MVLLGVAIVLNIAGVLRFNLFFDGWWTIFIFVPCFIGLISDRNKIGSIFGISIATLLLLSSQEIICWDDFWKYLLAIFGIIWGLTMIFGEDKCKKDCKTEPKDISNIDMLEKDGQNLAKVDVSFAKRVFVLGGKKFDGGDVKISFGAATLDLRGADIKDGAVINVNCNFGGLEIIAPSDIKIVTNISPSFGGVEDRHKTLENADALKTLRVEGAVCFGGLEIQ